MTPREAMKQTLAVFEAHGRAYRIAREATADWFDPPKQNVIETLAIYAWATRERRDLLPYYRARARRAVKFYRTHLAERKAA